MVRNGLLMVCIMMAVSACGFFRSEKPPLPPEPTLVVIEFEADGDINPDAQGRPSPLVIWIYQLKYYDAFKDADYTALIEDDAKALGKERIERHEIILQPNEKRTELLKTVSDDTRTIGFMGQFRDQNAQWRAATGIQKNKTTVIRVHVGGTALTSKLQVSQPDQR